MIIASLSPGCPEQMFKNSICKSLQKYTRGKDLNCFGIFFVCLGVFCIKVNIYSLPSYPTQIWSYFLLLGGHHTNIILLPLSICPSIQMRLKCKLDIWCCDVCDNIAHSKPTHIRTNSHMTVSSTQKTR